MGVAILRLADWLWLAFRSFTILIHNAAVHLLNKMIEGIATTAQTAIDALPDYTIPTPSQLVDNIGFVQTLNWLIPVGFIVDCLTMLVFGYIAFQTSAPVLRWTKLIR